MRRTTVGGHADIIGMVGGIVANKGTQIDGGTELVVSEIIRAYPELSGVIKASLAKHGNARVIKYPESGTVSEYHVLLSMAQDVFDSPDCVHETVSDAEPLISYVAIRYGMKLSEEQLREVRKMVYFGAAMKKHNVRVVYITNK